MGLGCCCTSVTPAAARGGWGSVSKAPAWSLEGRWGLRGWCDGVHGGGGDGV